MTSSCTALSLAASRPPSQCFQKRLRVVRRWETFGEGGSEEFIVERVLEKQGVGVGEDLDLLVGAEGLFGWFLDGGADVKCFVGGGVGDVGPSPLGDEGVPSTGKGETTS